MKKLLVLLFIIVLAGQQSFAQNITIKGKVTDSIRKRPLKGVKIVYQGNNEGVITDAKGRFTIEDVNREAVLMVSYDRYIVQFKKLNGSENVNIELERDRKFLEFSTDIDFFFKFHYGPDRTAKEANLKEPQKLWVYN